MSAPILIIPGRGGSGGEHWQSHWERALPNTYRVQQTEWFRPTREEWIATLDRAIASLSAAPILVAHSLACPLVAHWASGHSRPVCAALLVAPADADSESHTPAEARVFSPIPMRPLAFPSLVVASNDDPRCSIERAMALAKAWGSRFVDIGAKGHINVDAGFGPWPEGLHLLGELTAELDLGS